MANGFLQGIQEITQSVQEFIGIPIVLNNILAPAGWGFLKVCLIMVLITTLFKSFLKAIGW